MAENDDDKPRKAKKPVVGPDGTYVDDEGLTVFTDDGGPSVVVEPGPDPVDASAPAKGQFVGIGVSSWSHPELGEFAVDPDTGLITGKA